MSEEGERVPLLQSSQACINPDHTSESDTDIIRPASTTAMSGAAATAASAFGASRSSTSPTVGAGSTTVKLSVTDDLTLDESRLPPPRSHPAAKGITDVLDKLGLANEGGGEEIVRDLALYRDKRSGRIALILILTYITLGSLFFAFYRGGLVEDERPPFVDAFYYTIVTLTTVGYGDIRPLTNGAKLFACFFTLFGVGIVGYCLGLVLTYVQERRDTDLERRRREAQLRNFLPLPEPEPPTNIFARWWSVQSDVKKSIIRACATLALALSVGVVLMMVDGGPSGNCDFVQALYFSCITVTTVGYGDEHPHTTGGKVFGCFYLFFATIVYAQALSALADIPLSRRRKHLEQQVMDQYGNHLTPEEYIDLISGGASPDCCTRDEFIIRMLIKLNRITPEDVIQCGQRFDFLDADGNGRLNLSDVTAHRRWMTVKAASRVGGIFAHRKGPHVD